MFGLGVTELVIIFVLVLIIFGAGKLPELGTGIGTSIKNFKRGVTEDKHKEPSIYIDKDL